VIARELDGKMRVTSGSWEGEKVFLKDQVLEVRNVDGRLHVAQKVRKPDEGTRRSSPTIRTVRGTGVSADTDFVRADADFVSADDVT
jgi:hypothetical protein